MTVCTEQINSSQPEKPVHVFMLQWEEYFYLSLGYHFRYFKFSSGYVVVWDGQKCPGGLMHSRNSSNRFYVAGFLSRWGAVGLLWKHQHSALAELQHWSFAHCSSREMYLLFSISVLFFSNSKFMTSKLLPIGLLTSNTCLSLFRCYKFHQIIFAWLKRCEQTI